MNASAIAATEALLARYREALEMITTHDWKSDQCDNGYSARYVAETALAITSPTSALNEAIAMELERMADMYTWDWRGDILHRAAEIRGK